MLEGSKSYIYTREGDCHRLSNIVKNPDLYDINILAEDNNIYQKLMTVEKDADENKYYRVITDSGRTLIMADNDNITVRIDNPKGPSKEKRYVTINLMKQMLENNEQVNVYVSNNNFSAEMNEHKDKRRGDFYSGLVLALLLAPDSKFYINNPKKSYIRIRFLNDFQPKNLKKWVNDLTYSKYLEFLFGSEFILNCKSEMDRETIPDHVIKSDKYMFEDVLDGFVSKLFGISSLYWSDKDKNEIRGFSGIFDKNVKKIDEFILQFILTKTTYQFKSGFFQTIAQIYTTNMFEDGWKVNEFRTKDELLVEFMENSNYLYSSPYIVEKHDDYFKFKILGDKYNYTKVKSIVPYENVKCPVKLNVFKQNFISNGFEFMII